MGEVIGNMEGIYMQADPAHPFMGLSNEVCHIPRHWCACHRVWLSEKDAESRCCRNKQRDDGTCSRCTAFREDKFENGGIEGMLRKTRMPAQRGHRKSCLRKGGTKFE